MGIKKPASVEAGMKKAVPGASPINNLIKLFSFYFQVASGGNLRLVDHVF